MSHQISKYAAVPVVALLLVLGGGAKARAQAEKSTKALELNVRDYGAVGDGAAVDAVAIQSAINAANAAGGGTVLVPPGTYLVSLTENSPQAGQASALLMKSKVTLHLMRGATIKLAAGQTTTNESAIIRNQNAFATANFDHDMVIRGDGVVDGNAANNTGNITHGIYFGTAARCGVEGITVKNCRGTAPGPPGETLHVSFYRCGNYWVKSVKVFGDDGGDTASGIGSNFSTVGRIEDCVVHSMTHGVGITHYDSSNVITVNCHSYLNGGNGFLTEYSQDILFDSCMAGGMATDYDRSPRQNKVAIYSSTTFAGSLLGNGQNANNVGAAGFNITSGTRITVRGGMSAYNGVNVTQAACGFKIIGKCSDLLIDGVRIFGNRHGVDFTGGDGAPAVNSRMRTTRISPATLLGPNKHTDGSQPNSEIFTSSGSMTVSRGLINGFLVPAVPASGVIVLNNFPFDVLVNISAGTVTDVAITPGGPAPGAPASLGAQSLVTVPHGGAIAVTYTTAPTWKWLIP